MKFATLNYQGKILVSSLFNEPEEEPKGISDLIEDLMEEETEIAVVWDSRNSNILDIILNGASIGYFAIRTFCKIYGLQQTTTISYGVDPCEVSSDDYVVPLFGLGEEC